MFLRTYVYGRLVRLVLVLSALGVALITKMYAEFLLPRQEAFLYFLIPSSLLVSPYKEGLLIALYVLTQIGLFALFVSPLALFWYFLIKREQHAAKEVIEFR